MVASDTCASSSLRTSSFETCAKSVSGVARTMRAVHKAFIQPPEDGASRLDRLLPPKNPLLFKPGIKNRHSGGGNLGLLHFGAGLPRLDGVGEAAFDLAPQRPVGRGDFERGLIVRD